MTASTAWGLPLVLGDDGGGYRHFLDRKPVHCGTTLELAEKEWRSVGDDEDFVWNGKFTAVRYEVAWRTSKDGRTVRVPMMHKNVGGVDFTAPIEDHHRFRWPEER